MVLIACLIIALPSSLGWGVWSGVVLLGRNFQDFFDFISNSVLMPIVAFITCLFVGYVMGTKTVAEEVRISSKFRRERLFTVMIKFVAPVCIVLILVSSLLDALHIITI